MKAIIIEDEPRAAKRLQSQIEKLSIELKVVAVLESIAEAKGFLMAQPNLDIIFSDIELADGLSFEIFRHFDVLPPIVFTTAYDQYAIEAFKNNGIDYLLKPVQVGEIEQAIFKINQFKSPTSTLNTFRKAEQEMQNKSRYKERFMLKIGQEIRSILAEDIQAFYSLEKATYALTNQNKNCLLDYSLDQLEEVLNPKEFFRINRNFILNINAPIQITTYTNSRLKVTLKDYKGELIVVSRNRTKDFKTWLGM